ncbi:hypothetical protein Leryth_019844 [Lithospermum erythrorhizon]|nr:hypothetical protein Leryth_019844 [Lithospermum erythrorhizon]
MATRFFPNLMPNFVQETSILQNQHTLVHQTIPKQGTDEALFSLLSMPYSIISEKLKRAALDLKETVVLQTCGKQVEDFTLYSGTLGTAFLLFKSFMVTQNINDLQLCCQVVEACDAASLHSRDVTFLCGRAGVCALGAVVAKFLGDDKLLQYHLAQFKEITITSNEPDELLYGRAGYLWACLFINQHVGKETISSAYMGSIVNEIFKNGRRFDGKGRSSLMFEWYGERYWGAAHGLAGIMHVLLHFDLKPDESEDVKQTLKYMIENRLPTSNYPTSEEDRRRDALVHWCHGAPGVILTLVKAAEVFGDKEFTQAAIDAAEVVWNRGLLKRVGICHGISGNAYSFLSLYRLTGNAEHLYKAKAFSCFLLDRAHKLMSNGEMHGGDSRYSLFEGIGGMAYLFLDMVEPNNARFPAYEF